MGCCHPLIVTAIKIISALRFTDHIRDLLKSIITIADRPTCIRFKRFVFNKKKYIRFEMFIPQKTTSNFSV